MRVNSLTIAITQPNLTAPASRDSEPAKSTSREETKQAAPVEVAVEHRPPVEKPIINGVGLTLDFAIDKATGRNIIRVYDEETGKVVRQIPPEEVLNFLRQYESVNGLVLSRKL